MNLRLWDAQQSFHTKAKTHERDVPAFRLLPLWFILHVQNLQGLCIYTNTHTVFTFLQAGFWLTYLLPCKLGAPLPVTVMCFGFKSHLWVFNKVSETAALFIVTAMKGSSLLALGHNKPNQPHSLKDKCLIYITCLPFKHFLRRVLFFVFLDKSSFCTFLTPRATFDMTFWFYTLLLGLCLFYDDFLSGRHRFWGKGYVNSLFFFY